MRERPSLATLRRQVQATEARIRRKAEECREEAARWRADPPVCGQCGARAVLITGEVLYPYRNWWDRLFWACPDRHQSVRCDLHTLRPAGEMGPPLPPVQLGGLPPPDPQRYRSNGPCQRSDCRAFEVRGTDHEYGRKLYEGCCRQDRLWKNRCHSLRRP